jgi:hypothetical protein
MPPLRRRWTSISLLGLVVACHDGVTPPDSGIGVGESFAVTGAQSVKLVPGESGGDYVAVLVNAGITAGVDESYSLRASGILNPAVPALMPLSPPRVSRAEAPAGCATVSARA